MAWQAFFTEAPARRRVFERSSKASKESARALAARYGLNAKTVRKWRRRATAADEPIGPKTPRSTVLTPAEGPWTCCAGLPEGRHPEGSPCCFLILEAGITALSGFDRSGGAQRPEVGQRPTRLNGLW